MDGSAAPNHRDVIELTGGIQVSHAGIFSAKIDFREPLSVGWVQDSGDITHLGSFSMNELTVKHKRAYINQTVPFTIEDEDAFLDCLYHPFTNSLAYSLTQLINSTLSDLETDLDFNPK